MGVGRTAGTRPAVGRVKGLGLEGGVGRPVTATAARAPVARRDVARRGTVGRRQPPRRRAVGHAVVAVATATDPIPVSGRPTAYVGNEATPGRRLGTWPRRPRSNKRGPLAGPSQTGDGPYSTG